MTDPLFFPLVVAASLEDVADFAKARVASGRPAAWRVQGLASLDHAGPQDVTFFVGARHAAALRSSRAGACLLRSHDQGLAPPHVACLLTEHPARSFARLASILYPGALRPAAAPLPGVSIGASVDASARVEVGASIAPGVAIGRRVEIGTGTSIGSNCVVGDGVRIGRDCTIAPNVTIAHALIGDRVILHAGARIGQDGFGFVPDARGHVKVAQLGRVILQDDVEIGANSTVDRGALDDTIVGEGAKIDNLVQIAHNVVIGRHCLVAAQVGIAGSTRLADFVAVGGQAGIAGHLSIGRGARIAGQAGVLHDVPAYAAVGGSPAGPALSWLRAAVRARGGLKERS